MKRLLSMIGACALALVAVAMLSAPPASAAPPASGTIWFDLAKSSSDGVATCHFGGYLSGGYMANGIDPSGDFEFHIKYSTSPIVRACVNSSGTDITGYGAGLYQAYYQWKITDINTGALLATHYPGLVSTTDPGGVVNSPGNGGQRLTLSVFVCGYTGSCTPQQLVSTPF